MSFPRKSWVIAFLLSAMILGYGREEHVEAWSLFGSSQPSRRPIRIINPSIKKESDSAGVDSSLPTVQNPAGEMAREPSKSLDSLGSLNNSPILKHELPKLNDNESAKFFSEMADVDFAAASARISSASPTLGSSGTLMLPGPSSLNLPPITQASSLSLESPVKEESPENTEFSGQTSTSQSFKLPKEMNKMIKDVDFRETDVKDALRGLGNQIDLNMLIDNDITGPITIHFVSITFEEAFKMIMRSQKLAFLWEGKILRLIRAENAPPVTAIFKIQNSNAAKIKEIIDKMLTPQRGSSEVDLRTNAIIVKDTPECIESIREMLGKIDVKESTVVVQTKPVTEVFYLDYVDASNLREPIAMIAPEAKIQAYSSSQASTAGASGGAAGGRQDMMIITDAQSNLEKIRELIGKLDVAPTQVIIDAHIYEINLNEEERLGVNWQKQIPIPGTTDNVFNMSISPEDSTAGGTGVFRFGTLNVNQFTALLAMLQTKNFAKVLSNPVITTLNNKKANITVGQAIPYVSGSTTDVNGQVTSQIAQANANIVLDVTPSVTGNDEVFLDIKPTITSVLGFTSLGGNSTPNLSNRSAITQVIVRNNHTIVIGGMIKTDKSDTINKVPILGDLPGIGKLFQKKDIIETRTELIIFITPHIIRNLKNSELATKKIEMENSLAKKQPSTKPKNMVKKLSK
ncbi:MAG: type II secretion system protein GspD [Candidatus Riflebacteria bacterium]|nr:type II secretion system protein GspD [Candidatus Riflebacteria bacterium]